MDIPFDLLHIVASFHTKPLMKLSDWIPEDKLKWDYLSFNPNAIHMLEANPMKINWRYLSLNSNAIHMLEANPEKINWYNLSKNPNAMHMLKMVLQHDPDKPLAVINWKWLSENPSIFEIDTKQTQIYIRKKAKDIDDYL